MTTSVGVVTMGLYIVMPEYLAEKTTFDPSGILYVWKATVPDPVT
jgi:hypothetical protein